MQELLRDYLGELRSKRRKRRRISVAVTLLIVMVAGGVIGALVQYGVAMTGDAKCGLEEHTHSDECYENVLACGQEESEGHTHTDACYQTNSTLVCGLEESEEHAHGEECYVNEQVLICGQEEGEGHTHTDSCYDKQLVCGKEEHIHTDACYIDTTADVEESSDWDAQYEDTEWKDVWGEDLVTAAKVQVGYKESTKNYTVAADESHKGYTRYGQFAGDVYADWDAMFVNFCMHYAGLEDSNLFPNEKTAVEWYNKFVQVSETNLSYITAPEGYEPKVGDLIFFNKEEENEFRMGVVSSYDKEKNEIKVIEGNSENEVKENEYDADDEYIYAYLKITELETVYKDKGEEDSSAEETEEPTDGEEQDPQDEIPEEEGEPQDEMTEEEEELQEEMTEEEEWAYEESYDADKVIVHVKAKEGVIPEGAELSVTPIEKKEITDDMSKKEKKEAEKINEQYEMTNEKLNEESKKNEQRLEGFLAYDICFLVDGEEVEPSGEVQVTMDFKEAVVPEEVSKDATVAVNHLKEDGDGEVKVENLTEADTTTIQMLEEDSAIEKVELITDGFSIFSIIWITTEGGYNEKNMMINHVKYEGNERKILQTGGQTHSGLLAKDEPIQLKDKLGWEPITLSDGTYKPVRIDLLGMEKIIERDVQWLKMDSSKMVHFYKDKDSQSVYSCPFEDLDKHQFDIVYENNNTVSGLVLIDNIKGDNEEETEETEEKARTDGTLRAQLSQDLLDQWKTAEAEKKEVKLVWHKKVGDVEEEVRPKPYSDGLSNISEDGKLLYVALDNGALSKDQPNVEYWVELKIDGEKVAESQSVSISYYGELQNGSFEEPDLGSVAGQDKRYKYEEVVDGWQTTGKAIEIAGVYEKEQGHPSEKVTGTTQGYIDGLYGWRGLFSAAEGNQFAEINALETASLYQDVLTTKGVPLNYRFFHRARPSVGQINKMYLVIVPTIVAEKGIYKDGNVIDTQDEVKYLIEHRNEFSGVYVQFLQANTYEWTEHTGTYIPEYSLNRFFFVSAEESTPFEGNFIDDVWFGQKLPDPKPHTFNFKIEKTIRGLENVEIKSETGDKDSKDKYSKDKDYSEKNNELKGDTGTSEEKESLLQKINSLKFEINVTDIGGRVSKIEGIPNEVLASQMKWTDNGDGTFTGVYNCFNIAIDKGAQYNITVKETGGELEEQYSLISSVTKVSSGEWSDPQVGTEGTVTVTEGAQERLIFNNTYGPKDDSTWKVVKRSSSNKDELLGGAKFTLTEVKNSLNVISGDTDINGVVQWVDNNGNPYSMNTLTGQFILEESKAPENYLKSGKKWTLTLNKGKLDVEALKNEIKDDKDYISLASADGVHEISIYNDLIYALPSTGGSGIYWYMFSGILLMAGAILITYKKRCREVLRS